jgi:hypothetical protein
VRDGGELLDRLDGADLVVRPHHGDQRDAARVALDRGRRGGQVDAAEVVDGQPLDLGALVLGEPLDGSSTAWCSTELAARRGGARRRRAGPSRGP